MKAKKFFYAIILLSVCALSVQLFVGFNGKTGAQAEISSGQVNCSSAENDHTHVVKNDHDCTTPTVCAICQEIVEEASFSNHKFVNDCDATCDNYGCRYMRTVIHVPEDDDFDCTTPTRCSLCQTVIKEAPFSSHQLSIKYSKDNYFHVLKCDNDGCMHTEYGLHTFTQETVSDDNLKSEANCLHAKTYYKPCACGKRSNAHVFAVGEKNSDNHAEERVDFVTNNDGTHDLIHHCCGAAFMENVKCTSINSVKDCTAEGLCSCGYIIPPSFSSHSFDNPCDTDCNNEDCEHTRESFHAFDNACDGECNECGALREVSAHVYDNPCDTSCGACDFKRITLHSYGKWTIVKKAAQEENGLKERVCIHCGNKETKSISNNSSGCSSQVRDFAGLLLLTCLAAVFAKRLERKNKEQ